MKWISLKRSEVKKRIKLKKKRNMRNNKTIYNWNYRFQFHILL